MKYETLKIIDDLLSNERRIAQGMKKYAWDTLMKKRDSFDSKKEADEKCIEEQREYDKYSEKFWQIDAAYDDFHNHDFR